MVYFNEGVSVKASALFHLAALSTKGKVFDFGMWYLNIKKWKESTSQRFKKRFGKWAYKINISNKIEIDASYTHQSGSKENT